MARRKIVRRPDLEGDYPDIMERVMQDLGTQYRLVYIADIPHDGRLHKIKVEDFQVVGDKREDLKVRVRKGWRS